MYRKVAFSGKKKKEQLQLKRQRKDNRRHMLMKNTSDDEATDDAERQACKIMEQPINFSAGRSNQNRYNLQFFQESKKELEEMKKDAYITLKSKNSEEREISARYFDGYDFPVRPPWDYSMDKDILEANEQRYFKEYVDHLQSYHKTHSKELPFFELNIETWRQLWRVLEFSDILLIIVDVRYSTLMLPPSLYTYIVETMKKHAILVLNKVDLVAPEVVVAWRHYFQDTYPGLSVVFFASHPAKTGKGKAHARSAYKRSMEGVHNIYRECHKIVQSEVDIASWEQKILEDMEADGACGESEVTDDTTPPTHTDNFTNPYNEPHKMYRDGILTVGCIGFPNVGKSSLINALKGRKVVSVSRTPGHTKHFQTIFLTNTVRLCDCPGLVFPSATPKYLQVLLGSFPISQLKVPYPSLKFLAENLDMPKMLKLSLPEDYEEWCAAAIADAWALKRGFIIAKTSQPDRYRAANHLLRMCLAGQYHLMLQFFPPGFHQQNDKWLSHREVEEVKKYQSPPNETENDAYGSSEKSESENSDEENSSSADETNADTSEDAELHRPKSHNAFVLLEDE